MMKNLIYGLLLLPALAWAQANVIEINCDSTPFVATATGYKCPQLTQGSLPPAVGFEIRTDSTIAFTDIIITRRKTDISKAIRIEVRKGETVTVNGIVVK